jgi:hypothetical protein
MSGKAYVCLMCCSCCVPKTTLAYISIMYVTFILAGLGNALRKNCGIKEPKVIITRAWFVSLVGFILHAVFCCALQFVHTINFIVLPLQIFIFIIFILACVASYSKYYLVFII